MVVLVLLRVLVLVVLIVSGGVGRQIQIVLDPSTTTMVLARRFKAVATYCYIRR